MQQIIHPLPMNRSELFYDRKDIARLTGLSVEQVAHNEAQLGIKQARQDINARVVRYHKREADEGMRKKGIIRSDS